MNYCSAVNSKRWCCDCWASKRLSNLRGLVPKVRDKPHRVSMPLELLPTSMQSPLAMPKYVSVSARVHQMFTMHVGQMHDFLS